MRAGRVGLRGGRDVLRSGRVRGHVLGLASRRGLPGDVDDGRGAAHEVGKRAGVADVALHEVDAGPLQPSGVVWAADEGAHAEPGRAQRVRDVAPDESGAARQRDEVAAPHRATLSQS